MDNGRPSGAEPNIDEEVFPQNTGVAANSALPFTMSPDASPST